MAPERLTVGLGALALCALRLGFIRVCLRAGARSSGLPQPVVDHAWTGLVSQAVITPTLVTPTRRAAGRPSSNAGR